MRKVSIFKKYKLYKEYINILKKNKEVLLEECNARVDKIGRIYSVVNIPIDEIGAQYTLKKSDIDQLSSQFVTEYRFKLSTLLNNIGLVEFYKEYEIKKVGKTNYLIVFGFSLFRTDIFAKNLFYKYLPIAIVFFIISYFLFKLFF